jgi:hypothetical protein
METWIGGAMCPDCGPEMEGGTSYSEEDVPMPSEENACVTAGADVGAPVSTEENGPMASGVGASAPMSAEGDWHAHQVLVHT